MKVRVLKACGIALLGIPLIIFSEYLVFTIALGALSLMATFEFLRAVGLHRRYALTVPALFISALLPELAHSSIVPRENQMNYIVIVALVLFAYLLYLLRLSFLV